MELQKFTTQLDFISATVKLITTLCSSQEGILYIALSGGGTPRPVYQALAANPAVDFNRIEWFLVDERYVPFGHPDSNYKMIMEAFGAAQPDFSEHFHYFNTSLAPEEAARVYEAELKNIPEQKFDLIFLGIGHDGHTASLFPQSPALQEAERLAVATINESAPNQALRDRLTITWPMILGSKEVIVLVSGKSKQPVVDEIFSGVKDEIAIPIKRLKKNSKALFYYGNF